MQLSDFYPSPNELIKSELSVLEYLRSSTYVQEKQPRAAHDVNTYYLRNSGSRTGFDFESYFDTWHAHMPGRRIGYRGGREPASNVRLFVAARIGAKGREFTSVSYCLSVCRLRPAHPSPRLSILRKFHFDVATAEKATRRQQHPRCHLQYCGSMLPLMRDLGCTQGQLDQMHPKLSEPRIFFQPMSLALLIDMAMREFPDDASKRFRQNHNWRGLVRAQEALVLRPFYSKCVSVIDDHGEDNQTLADAFYVG